MDFLKEGLNKIKGLNIEIDVRTSDKLGFETYDSFIELYFDGKLTFRIFRDANVTARGNAIVEAWGNASVEVRENANVTAWGNASVEAWGNARVTLKNM